MNSILCCDKIIAKSAKKGQQEEGSFDFLKRLMREEPDEPFENESGRARSGSFNLMWSRSLLQFWEVSVVVISLALTVIVSYNPH